jgi:hypothetical protein
MLFIKSNNNIHIPLFNPPFTFIKNIAMSIFNDEK